MLSKIVIPGMLALFGFWMGASSFAQGNVGAGKGMPEIVAAATNFLASLDEGRRGKVVFDFKDEAQRKRWSNLPTSMSKRGGLRMGDFSKAQREAAMAILAAALSPMGYEKVVQIVEADENLKQTGGQSMFGRDEYYISFLGTPSLKEPWIIQFGGHHLGLNITLAGEKQTLRRVTPVCNPRFMSLKARPFAHWAGKRIRRLRC